MSNTSYLQRIGQSWYVRVKVPRRLQGRVGNTHVRRALGTRDLDEANHRKWAAIALIRSHLERMEGAVGSVLPALAGAPLCAPQDVSDGTVRSPAIRMPGRLEDHANRGAQSLDDLLGIWLSSVDYLVQTKQQHRQAYGELRRFLGRSPMPMDITTEVAVEFVEERIKRCIRSYATKRRKVNSLIAFWHWLGSRHDVPRGFNPWMGFRLGKKGAAKRSTCQKRAYTMEELQRLLAMRPQYPGLADVIVLGLLTGARLEEICALRQRDIRCEADGVWFVNIAKAKTHAGVRKLAVCHPVAAAVLGRRCATAGSGEDQVFPEFSGGGYDDKLSWAVSKAFGRFRDKVGLSRETDFHSFRRTFITLMENLSVDQVRIARYVGHELPTMAFMVYSGGSTEQTVRETAAMVKLPPEVETALAMFTVPAGVRNTRSNADGLIG